MDEYMILGRYREGATWEVLGFEPRRFVGTDEGVQAMLDCYAKEWNVTEVRAVKVDTVNCSVYTRKEANDE